MIKKKKEEEFSLEEKDITIEVHGWILNGFASVCPRVVERAFGNEVLLEYLSFSFERIIHFGQAKLSTNFVPKSLIYRPLIAFQNSNEKLWLLGIFFENPH